MQKSINYAQLDRNMWNLSEKLIIAKKHGYNYVTEAYKKMYEERTATEIGNIFLQTKPAIRHHLMKMGVKMRTRGGRNNTVLSEQDVLQIYASQKPNKEIAKEFGVSLGLIKSVKYGKNWTTVTGPKKRRTYGN